MRKGALVAQNPTAFEDIQGSEALDEDEISALRNEAEYKWKVPWLLYLTIITCSIGAAVQGWDQEGSNGANLTFPAQFGIGGDTDHDVLLVGLINSAPYIGSALIGCWLSDPLNCHFGRRGMRNILSILSILSYPFYYYPTSLKKVNDSSRNRNYLHFRDILLTYPYWRSLNSELATALNH